MPRSFWIAISLLVIGFILLLLPDKGEAIIALNTTHGPSLMDLIALGLFAIGWIWVMTKVILSWKKISMTLGSSKLFLLLLIYVVGIFLIIVGLRIGNDFFLWTGIILSAFSNGVLILQAYRTSLN